MRGDFASPPNGSVFLNLDEGSDFGIVADGAPIEVDQIWMEDLDCGPQNNIGRNWHHQHSIRRFPRLTRYHVLHCGKPCRNEPPKYLVFNTELWLDSMSFGCSPKG